MVNINLSLNYPYCSVCFGEGKLLTQVQGTILCKECLAKAVEKYKNNDEDLKQNVEDIIVKDDDIYQ